MARVDTEPLELVEGEPLRTPPVERRPRTRHSAGKDARNVYFAAVNVNPADSATLLGLFPVLLGTDASISLVAEHCTGLTSLDLG